MRSLVRVVLAGWAAASAGAAGAQIMPSASFEASAIVVPGCRLDGGVDGGTIGALDFGVHPALSRAVVTTALVARAAATLRCTPGTEMTMSLGGGRSADGGRGLTQGGGAARIPYDLFVDAAFVRPIGIDQPVGLTADATGVVALPIFGRLRLPGAIPGGLYADTVLLTLNW